MAAVAAAALVASFLPASSASADIAPPYFATTGNASDPHIIECTNPGFGGGTPVDGYCLYTSRDMGQSYAYPGNYYPMRYTRVYFSENGYSGWSFMGTAFNESSLWVSNGGWVPDNAYHLWAPAAVQNGSYYYLYVPDVSDISNDSPPNSSTSSRIAVARSTTPFGPFTYLGTVPYSSGYMSDPDVLIDGSNRYLIWANGDNSSCGGLSTARLNADMLTLVANSTQTVTVNNIGALGNCGGTGRPYLEGASLYKFNDSSMPGPYTLVFAAKPTTVPEQCTQYWAGTGNAGTSYEVIAYATASTPQGPYTYKGIITCGSTTEWTNQASIVKVPNASGNARWMLVYHDAPGSTKERKLHAECLLAGNGMIAGVYRQPLDGSGGFNDCMANVDAAYSAYAVNIGRFDGMTFVSARSGGAQSLAINRAAVGPWERFREYTLTNGNVAYRALANGKYLCASGQNELQPSCTSSSDTTAQFVKVVSGNTFKLKAAATGYWVRRWYYYTDDLYHLQPWGPTDSGDSMAAVFTKLEL